MIRSGWANSCGIELFTHGWVQCPSATVPPTVPGGGGRGSGRTSGIRPLGYTGQREDALAETRRKRILREDDDIVAIIGAMLTRGLM